MLKDLIKKIAPSFLIGWYHLLLAFFGAVIYGFPSRKMVVIGITGTKGKSTVIEFCHQIFQEAGYKVASLSSIRFKIKNEETSNSLKMTMPGRFKIQRFFKKALVSGCKYMILEVTSEGILQHRHEFINFDAAVFTNLSPEHIERHGSFENYRSAKGDFFKAVKKTHIINLDDENTAFFLQFPAMRKWGYSTKISNNFLDPKFQTVTADNIEISEGGTSFSVNGTKIKLNVCGRFNVLNALAAICVGLSQNIGLEVSSSALAKVRGIKGRMEIVIKKPFKVVVDYAHTPDALQKVYESFYGKSRLLCILGSAGGGRDKWKRPKMGEIAAKYCDEIIITNEDPYDEEPIEIINQVSLGTGQKAKKILDRREAIKEALKNAKPGDAVVITGKGCEPWMCVSGGKKIPWDERKIVEEEFKKISK
ncbi:MAG: UDP-N-acetylmuramoyl-L-alanyl-D-glutamate--2,6-diaminopimelate ligase [Candidatus Paceibacterota bacterium]